MKIPAGVDTGTRIQLAGKGEVGPAGGPPGDLYVEIVEKPHPTFSRRGDDIHCTLEVPMTAAALGTTVELATLEGVEQVDVRPGTQSGEIQTLRGLRDHPPARQRAAATSSSTCRCSRRPGSTSRRRSSCASSPGCAARSGPRAGWRRPTRACSRSCATASPAADPGVTAPLYLVEPEALAGVRAGDLFVLDGDEGHHAATVRRARPGETLLVASGEGLVARGVVEDVAASRGAAAGRVGRRRRRRRRRGSCSCRPWRRAAATSWRSRRPPSSASTPSCRGSRRAASWCGRGSGASGPAASGGRRCARRRSRPAGPSSRWCGRRSRRRSWRRPCRRPPRVVVLHEDAELPVTAVPLPAAGTDGEVWVVVGPEGGISDARARRAHRRRCGRRSGSGRTCCARRPPGRPRSRCSRHAWAGGDAGRVSRPRRPSSRSR